MAFTHHELKHKTLAELRDIAKDIEHEAVQGYTQLNKEHLVVALCKALNIDMHEHHEVVGVDKVAIKLRIKALKAKRDAALTALMAKEHRSDRAPKGNPRPVPGSPRGRALPEARPARREGVPPLPQVAGRPGREGRQRRDGIHFIASNGRFTKLRFRRAVWHGRPAREGESITRKMRVPLAVDFPRELA